MPSSITSTTELCRLNSSERAVLRLLAEGHTAKSIAISLCCSPGAVNERLREARRKTGASSSRELARLLRLHENRDDELGVAASHRDGPVRRSAAHSGGHAGKKGFIMISATLALLTAVTIAVQAPVDRTGQTMLSADPVLETALAGGEKPVKLRAEFVAERRDDTWAAPTERGLKRYYDKFALTSPVQIACARTLCEVSGVVTTRLNKQQIDALLFVLRPRVDIDAARLRLVMQSASLSESSLPDRRPAFVTYLRRAPS